MTWKGKPELLLSQYQEGAKKGVWTVPTIFERDKEGEREAVVLGLLKQTGLPINPNRFIEVAAEQKDQTRRVSFAVCLTSDESLAARQGLWPRKAPQKRLEWWDREGLPDNFLESWLRPVADQAWERLAATPHEAKPPDARDRRRGAAHHYLYRSDVQGDIPLPRYGSSGL